MNQVPPSDPQTPPPTVTLEWPYLSPDQKRLYKQMNKCYKDLFIMGNGMIATPEQKDALKEFFFRAACDFVLSMNTDLQDLVIAGQTPGYVPEVHN
jgi:hypothetical protein